MRWITSVAVGVAFLAGGGVAPAGAQRPAANSNLAIVFQRAFAVGGAQDTSVLLTHLFPQDIAIDRRGGFVVLNREDASVVQFDSTGRRVRRLGRKGGGPGEFKFPVSVAVDPGGRVWVHDLSKRALVGFDERGAVVQEVSTRGPGTLQRLAWTAGNARVLERTRGDTVTLLRARGSDTVEVARVVRPPARPVDRTACGLIGETRRPVFSAELHWTTEGSVIALNVDGDYSVTLVRASGPPQVLRRSASPPKATHDMALRALGSGDSVFISGRGWCTTPASVIVAGAGVAAHVPAYSRLLIDPMSRVWALHFRLPGDSASADVFTSERGYVGTVSLGARNPVAFLTDGRMVSLEHDRDEVPLVVVYSVRWPR